MREFANQLDEEQAIAIRELDPTAHLALPHGQLTPQRCILCFQAVNSLVLAKPQRSRCANYLRHAGYASI
jgi:hypothetical protein